MTTFMRISGATLLIAATVLDPATGRAGGPVGTSGGPEVPFKGCYYYEHIDFGGDRRDIPYGVRRRYVGDRWNDQVSSIACAYYCSLRVWQHRDFGGSSYTFHANTSYVGDGWNDQISSMEVMCDE